MAIKHKKNSKITKVIHKAEEVQPLKNNEQENKPEGALDLVNEIKEVALELKELNESEPSLPPTSNTETTVSETSTTTSASAAAQTSANLTVPATPTAQPVTPVAETTTSLNTVQVPTADVTQTKNTEGKTVEASEKPIEHKEKEEAKAETPSAEQAKPETSNQTPPAEQTKSDTPAQNPSAIPEATPQTIETKTDTAASSVLANPVPTTQEPAQIKATILDKIKGFLPFAKKQVTTDSATPAVKKPSNPVVKIVLLTLSVLIVLLLIGAGITYFMAQPIITHGKKTATLAQETYQLLKEQNLPKAKEKITQTKTELLATQAAYKNLSWLKIVPFVSTYVSDIDAGLKAGVAGVEAGEILVDTIEPYADVLGFQGKGTFTGGTAEDRIVKMVETLDKVTPKLEIVGKKMQTVQDELDQINPADYPEQFQNKAIRSKIVSIKDLVKEATVALTDARPLVEVLPQIMGYPKSKRYLVIFQNDGELRPTGGFMSAYAVLTLDKGRVKAEKSDDIYSLDKKFGNKIKAPEVLKLYLNEDYWHLRNMNLSPDFYISMKTFDEYYSKLPDEYQIDGIFTIDTEVLRQIVAITGPLDVPGYGTFTVENDKRCNLAQIVCELEYIIDKPLATIVTNRKTAILGPMMQALLARSMGGGKEQLAKLIPLGFKLLEEKRIATYFKDPKIQKAADSFNITGRVNAFDGDYFMTNDANFGGAKSNFYVTQEVEQDITIANDGTVTKNVTLQYTHSEPEDNCNLEDGELCLSGRLRNYFRVYVPKGSILVEGLGSMTAIKAHEDLGKTYFDGFFELRGESKAKVRLTYTLPFKVKKGSDYLMLIQKQAGTKDPKYTIKINGQEDSFTLGKDLKKSWKI